MDDMVAANHVLYGEGEKPDHTVVIKYMPSVGDNKRAMDEYYAEIFMGGHQTIFISNVCEDSLLASPLIVDLVVLCEVVGRIRWRTVGDEGEGGEGGDDGKGEWKGFHEVLSVLSYMLKVSFVTRVFQLCF